MPNILVVRRESGTERLLQPLRDAGVSVTPAAPEDDIAALLDEADADAAVIAPEIDGPVRVARAIHNAAPDAHIVFIADDRTEPLLRRELLLAPRIGRHWSLTRADSPAAAAEAVHNAVQSTVRRRQMRTTIGRINLRLAAAQPQAARTVVSDHFLATVLHQLSDGVIMIDTDGKIVSANEAARRVFGPRLARGANLVSVVAGDGEQLAAHLQSAAEDISSEVVTRRGAQTLIIDVRLTKVRNERGEIVGTAILARDVTAKRHEERRQRLIAEASLALSSTLDLDVAMQRLAEFLAGEFGGAVAVDIYESDAMTRRGAAVAPPNEHLSPLLKTYAPHTENHPGIRAFRSGTPVVDNDLDDATLRSVTVDAEHAALLRRAGVVGAAAIPFSAAHRLVGAFTMGRANGYDEKDLELLSEIGEVTTRAVENIWLYHAAEQANRAKEEFLAMLSHELRTPMTAVLGWVQLMRGEGVDGRLLREGLDAMEQAARTQAQLIDDLLDLSRIQTGKLHLEIQTVDLGLLARAALDTIRPAAKAKKINIDARAEEDLLITGDPNRLQQVIWNLLSNSVKFTERGGNVQISVAREGSNARLEVCDTGRGIDPEFLPFVFERFRQAESAATRRYGGLGLGLAIVRQIVELHGGTVTGHSEGVGHGATFTILLPLAAVRRLEPEQVQPRVSLEGISVLLVEDDPGSALLLRRVLESAGADVRYEKSAQGALAALRDRIPDVMVSDIAMPEEDGFALIHHVRSTLRIPADRMPAVALSAFSDIKTRVNILGAGFQKFMQKPVENEDLTRCVADLAAKR